MKPFNLEKYLANPNRKLVTKEGKTVKRILCTDARGGYPVIALVDCGDYDSAFSYTKDGKHIEYKSSSSDLFFVPEKHEGWFNIYHSDESGFYVRQYHPYKSKDEADEIAKANHRTFFATVKIEWEE